MARFSGKYLLPALGILFLYAGLYKLIHPGQAEMALEALGVSRRLASLAVTGALVFEVYLGVILLFRIDLRYSLSLAMGLMFAFTVYLWYLSTLANPPSCGCLGLTGIFKSNKHAALFGVFRNCVLLWLLKLSYDYHCKTKLPAAQPQAA